MRPNRGRVLGRGLEALIPLGSPAGGAHPGLPQQVAIDEVSASPDQMRERFPADSLHELADSIRHHGVLQPVLLRRKGAGYELLAGERRLRAARMAGLTHVPAIVRSQVEGSEGLLLGLVENLQREDLDPIEEARGVKRLIEQFGLTQEEAAARIGKHRVSVAQALRLLAASPAVVSATAAGAITAGHGRALAGLAKEDQERGVKLILARQLSVRQTERWARAQAKTPVRRPARTNSNALDRAQATLRARFGDGVSVQGTDNQGQITLRYESADELGRLLVLLTR